ncbi:MAG: CDP-alcohol phosphatidyltransferase family protein [Deltaproteobacteria bacterium]|nr:CDP-alcohol phosphatidyltransferase family protein [Deltaproteobacteria bacterium]
MFGIKDIFTTINLLGGIVGICLCIDGRPYEAGVAVMAGYLFGDTLDGYVARKLGTANQFGAEFDTISDHTSHVIAPAAIVYTVYKDVGLFPAPWDQLIAIALAASLILAVSVRHARNIVAPVEYKGVWVGLPRSVLGFWAIAYCNATLARELPGGWWIGIVLIPAMGIATLTYLPFPSHRLGRSHRWYLRYLIFPTFFGSLGAGIVVWPEYLFDIVFFWMAGYAFTGWLSLDRDELRAYAVEVAAAKQRAADAA